MALQTKQEIIIIPILPNIRRPKDNHGVKLRQLIESNARNIFPIKSCRK